MSEDTSRDSSQVGPQMTSLPPRLLELMRDPRNVRCVALIAHIDHGKSTFADTLLAEGKLLAPELVGARYLDYLEEEQRRGITIKTAAITLLLRHPSDGREYVLHLIDTPGHVDFSGKVTRALRLADGAIVVVDAVEGVMSQTEYVVREALEEYVRPILFINKLDRLIDELSLTEHEIMKQLAEIVRDFNSLIDLFAVDPTQKRWKVTPESETLFMGSALQRWGFTVPLALSRGVKFRHIIELYKSNREALAREFPLGELAARLIYEKLPSPIEAQRYRVSVLWRGEPPEELVRCESAGPLVAYVSKFQFYRGRILVTGRVFSGVLRRGKYLVLGTGERVSVLSVAVPRADRIVTVSEIPAGNVFSAVVDAVPRGRTIASKPLDGAFRDPHLLVAPVIAVSVAPKKLEDFKRMMAELEALKVEDQDLTVEVDKDTGEVRLYGIGELHLELALKELNSRVPVTASEPRVVYKETVVAPVKISRDDVEVEVRPRELGELVTDGTNEIEILGLKPDERDAIRTVIDGILRGGKRGQGVIAVKVSIKCGRQATTREVLEALSEAFTRIETVLLEPLYRFDIITVPDYLGVVTGELKKRRAVIESVDHAFGAYVRISGVIPAETSLGLVSTVRSATRGRVYVQLKFIGWRRKYT